MKYEKCRVKTIKLTAFTDFHSQQIHEQTKKKHEQTKETDTNIKDMIRYGTIHIHPSKFYQDTREILGNYFKFQAGYFLD